jgi:hypothetical protein
MAAFASFPVRAASDKAAALSANTGVPIVSKQHTVTKALAMEASLEVVPQHIQLRKVGFRTALQTLKKRMLPSASQDNPSASLGNADGPFLSPSTRGRLPVVVAGHAQVGYPVVAELDQDVLGILSNLKQVVHARLGVLEP